MSDPQPTPSPSTRPYRGPVLFLTHEYELSHGRRPGGRGSWAFYFRHDAEPWWARRPDGSSGGMLYTEAKKLATAEARRRGLSLVQVAT